MDYDYTTRELIEAIEISPPARNFLTRTFFPTERTHMREKIEFDVKKGKRVMAPFVSPRVNGKIIARKGYTTKEFQTPKLAPERVLTIDDISTRVAGEDVYSKRTPAERADELLAEDITELNDSITRRIEWMARQVLFTGKLDVVDEDNGIDIQIDFGFDNIYVLDSDSYWSLSTYNPMPLLNSLRKKIIKDSGVAPDILLMSGYVIEEFLSNPYIEKEMNILKYKNIVIEPKIVDDALTFYGRIESLGMDIYSYYECFVNDEGDDDSMVPDGACLMANSKYGMGVVDYGLVTQMENDEKYYSYEGKFVPKIYVKDENKMVRITSRPLTRPKDVQSWAVIYPIGKGGIV